MNSRKFAFGLTLALTLAGGLVAVGCETSRETTATGGASQQTRYQCPMHPHYTADDPGACPICGMDLVPIEGSGTKPSASQTAGAQVKPSNDAAKSSNADDHRGHGEQKPQSKRDSERKPLYWVAPMDPTYRSDKPGKSPMGMDLVPVYEDDAEAQAGHEAQGRVTVEISPRKQQLLGVRTTEVNVKKAVKSLRGVGFVQPNQDRLEHLHAKLDGWLEKVHVQTKGDPVTKGQVLFELYSPRLVATQEELLSALRVGNERAANAARERMRYWNVSPEDIRAIEKRGSAMRTVPFRSPMSGYVYELQAVEGMYAREMTELYTLMNIDEVWVIGKFYETDVPLLKQGTEARIHLPDGTRLTGETRYVYPTVDPQTRFASVRFVFDNENMRLLPGMYVEVAYQAELGPGLVVPRDAVILTGERAVAFVAQGEGLFEPRELDLGPPVDGGYIVYGGLDDGERVVESANFFIDSESSLKAALRQFEGGGHAH